MKVDFDYRGTQRNLNLMKLFYIMFGQVFLLLYIIITTHQTENLKLVDFIAYKLYSNKAGLKMREVMRINMLSC